MKFFFATLFLCTVSFCARAQDVSFLPDYGGEKAAQAYDYFPSRLHAFVFRNWTSVPQKKLAEVLETSEGNVREIALEMGLPEQEKISPLWLGARGYITVLRRNWHLLNYEQTLLLLGIDAKQLEFRLIEDDFLFYKLGNKKPLCEKLTYQKSSTEILKKAEAFKESISSLGLEKLSNDANAFEFVEEFARPHSPSGKPSAPAHDENIYMAFSYMAEYGDALLDPELASYPEGLLACLKDNGVNAVWLHTVLRTLVERDGSFPGDERAAERMAGLKRLVSRCEKYGIKVFIYLNEPRGMTDEFFESSPERAAMRGSRLGELSSLCTSQEKVRAWLKESVRKIFAAEPKLGGVFAITASENLTNCMSKTQAQFCPVCKARGGAAVIAEVNNTIYEGVKAGSPSAKMIAWDWGWQEPYAADAIGLLDRDIMFMSVSEWALPFTRGGVEGKVGEYSISCVGPGPRALPHWKIARSRGMKTMAKVQANITWEFASVPVLPVARLVAEHAENLAKLDMDGALLSWSLGGFPSVNLDLFSSYDKSKTREQNLVSVAQKHYKNADFEKLLRAWEIFAEGYSEFPYNPTGLYCGPQHAGPANPIYLKQATWAAGMVCIPYDTFRAWTRGYAPEIWTAQMRKVADGFARALPLFEGALKNCDARARREAGWARVAKLHFESSANQAEFYRLRGEAVSGKAAETKDAKFKRMGEILEAEERIVREILPIVLHDGLVAYESSNHYLYAHIDLFEKLASIRHAQKNLESIR